MPSLLTVRRRTEANICQARETLQAEVEQRRPREDEIRKLNQELSKRAAELEATNKELESFTYRLTRPAGTGSPHGWILGAGIVRHRHTAFRQQIFDVTQA